jgi:dTDP-4-amino-4,6-dideoxygalactose transaminase
VRLLREHGSEQKYRHEIVGYNFRLEGIQGAVLNVKLKYLDGWNDQRRAHAAHYRELLIEANKEVKALLLPQELPYARHIYHLYVVQTEARDALQKHLSAAGIQTGIHYPVPVHLQPAYRSLGHRLGDFPVAERQAARVLSLPMFPELSDVQIARVTQSLRAFAGSQLSAAHV